MTVGMALAVVSIEHLILPPKDLTKQERYEGDMREIFGIDVSHDDPRF